MFECKKAIRKIEKKRKVKWYFGLNIVWTVYLANKPVMVTTRNINNMSSSFLIWLSWQTAVHSTAFLRVYSSRLVKLWCAECPINPLENYWACDVSLRIPAQHSCNVPPHRWELDLQANHWWLSHRYRIVIKDDVAKAITMQTNAVIETLIPGSRLG